MPMSAAAAMEAIVRYDMRGSFLGYLKPCKYSAPSLADLSNCFEVVRTMRTILQLAVVTVAPVAPLLLTMMSLEDLLKKLLGILF